MLFGLCLVCLCLRSPTTLPLMALAIRLQSDTVLQCWAVFCLAGNSLGKRILSTLTALVGAVMGFTTLATFKASCFDAFVEDAAFSVWQLSGNFDIVLDHLSRCAQQYTPIHAPCAILYVCPC